LDRRAILSNIAFISKYQVSIHCSGRGVDTAHPQRYRGVMWRGYDSGVVLREDIIERMRQYYAEIEQLQKEIDEVKERLKVTIKER